MSKACYDCPLVMDDCFRKDCIAADGYPRDVTVVNRMYPGPSIRVRNCHVIIQDEYSRTYSELLLFNFFLDLFGLLEVARF